MKTLKEVKAQYLTEALARPIGKYVWRNPRTGEIEAAADYEWEQPDAETGESSKAVLADAPYFVSASGGWYKEAELPEQQDQFCLDRYTATIRAERDARIGDTDDYIRMPDSTVMQEEGAKREALSDAERKSVLAYREALRNMPELKGFPFVDFPAIPSAIEYECSLKIEERNKGDFR